MASAEQRREFCRLCYNETLYAIDIFGPRGVELDYSGKLTKYLYLQVDPADDLPRTVCWNCSQHLDAFHKFFEKVNEIQRTVLKEKYFEIALSPGYARRSHRDGTKDVSDDNYFSENVEVVKVVVISGSENNDIRHEIVEELEEYELLEVRNDGDAEDKPVVNSEENSEKEVPVQLNLRRSLRRQTKLRESNFEEKSKPSKTIVALKRSKIVASKQKAAVNRKRKQLEADEVEGESGEEFSSCESEREEWSGHSEEFPKEIIRNGMLVYRGKKLMALINKFYSLECESCKDTTKFCELKDLFDHYANKHKETGYVTCCQTKITRYPVIVMHMARHLQPEAFKCDECGYVVTRPRFLESHKQTHLPENEKQFACDLCPKRFSWKGALKVHMISHQPEDERPRYVCHLCGKAYDYPGGLSTHKKYVHSNARKTESNICHICAKSFATRTGLREHMATIHQPREMGQVQCSECGKWLMNQRCLRTHMILHSDQEFKCDHCEYSTKKKVLLNRHVISRHTNEKPFECKQCGRAFKMKRQLTIHMTLHSNTKTFKCTFCDRVYRSSTNCYMHRKSKHPAELEEWNRKKEEAKRLKRINAGIEEPTTDEESASRDCS